MDKFKIVSDFSSEPTIIALIYSVASAMPQFFSISLFVIWIFGSASSYFAILRSTGKKRFFHVITSFSFGVFILSILFASLNSSVVQVLNGYWVGFYALMTGLSYLGLSQYK